MIMMNYKLGDKVKIKGNWNFPNDCTGVISNPPESVVQLVADHEPWDGIHRMVKGRKNLFKFYWVNFDIPQIDSDGDGPYNAGEKITLSHCWDQSGSYNIRAKAKDENGEENGWATLEVSMPKNRILLRSFFPRLYKNFIF